MRAKPWPKDRSPFLFEREWTRGRVKLCLRLWRNGVGLAWYFGWDDLGPLSCRLLVFAISVQVGFIEIQLFLKRREPTFPMWIGL